MAHRIKSRWTVRHRNTFSARTNLGQDFYTHIAIEHLDGTEKRTLSGAPSTFPNARRELLSHATFAPERVLTRDSWTMPTLAGTADVTLQLYFDPATTGLAPFGSIASRQTDTYRLEVQFHEPALTISPDGEIEHRSNTLSRHYVMPADTPESDRRSKRNDFSVNGTNYLIQMDYVLPAEAVGDDCRRPIIRIEESRLEGFTTEPIALRGYWSQTFSDIHIPESEEFLFEPRLEAGLPIAQLARTRRRGRRSDLRQWP